jgi:uncharacterized protein (TIRG00374 family)
MTGDVAAGPDPDAPRPPGDPASAPAPATAPAVPAAPARRGLFRRIPREVRITLFVIILIGVVEYVLLPEVAKARKSVHKIENVDWWWLLAAVIAEAGSLLAYAQLTFTVLSPGAPRRFRLFLINMWSLAVSHVLPGGTAPGAAAAYRSLLQTGVPPSAAGFGLAMQGVGSAVVLNALFWAALVVSIPLNGFNPLYGTAAILGTLLLAAFGGVVFLLTRGRHRAADLLYRVAVHLPLVNPDKVAALTQSLADRLQILLSDRRLLLRAMAWAAANWILDAASLWIFLFAFGATVFPIDLMVAYGLANILAAIPITPGGLGVVETVCAASLVGFGVPPSVAALGVLAWRLINFWLPIPIGGIAYLSFRFGPQGRRERAARSADLGGSTPALEGGS